MLIVANWKMNLGKRESIDLAKQLLQIESDHQIVVFPSLLNVDYVGEIISDSAIQLGVQNFHPADEGAFTGEVSLRHFESCIDYVLVGHSERRHIICDPPKLIARKVSHALKERKKVILCVGETWEIKNQGKTWEYINHQLYSELPANYSKGDIIIAYEPVWAIGSGRTPTNEEIGFVVNSIIAKYDLPVLYGGSVTPDNVEKLCELKNISGFLVGGASLDFNKFTEIVYKAK